MSTNYNILKKSAQEKLRILLDAVNAGESREVVATRFGYLNVKSLDSFLRRRDYIWDRYQQRYVEKPSPSETSPTLSPPIPDQVARILGLWEKPEADAKTIAKQVGFENHREMAKYMAAHGYEWSSEVKTYVPTSTSSVEVSHEKVASISMPTEEAWQSYGVLLSWLSQRQDALQSLLSLADDPQFLPRYVVPGVQVTKSVHMSHLLDQLARDYSREKHVSQREIFEVALTEFFQRHGYHDEIKRLFKGT